MEELKLQAEAQLPTPWGTAQIRAYAVNSEDRTPMVALIFGKIHSTCNVRLHSECLTGDVFSSLKCDCGDQLSFSLKYLGRHGGILLYLRQEGRDIGLINKIKAYALQDQGADTIEANHQLGLQADLRTYDKAAKVLIGLGVEKVHILTNNPEKVTGLEQAGIKVIERLPIVIQNRPENERYLRTKKDLMGHWFE